MSLFHSSFFWQIMYSTKVALATKARVYELLTKDIIHAAVEGFNGIPFFELSSFFVLKDLFNRSIFVKLLNKYYFRFSFLDISF